MENTHPMPPLTADATEHPLAVERAAARLIGERLQLLAEQATTEMVMAVLVVLGYTTLFLDQIEIRWLLCGAPVIGAGLIRIWLARKFLQCRSAQHNLTPWLKLFVLISIVSGLAWGIFASVLIYFGSPHNMAYISLLIVGLAIAAILSLAALLRAYIGYTLGILVPIALTLLVRGDGFDAVLASVIMAYGAFLSFSVIIFRRRLNNWLQLAGENVELVNRLYDLYDEQRRTDQAWGDLEGRLEQLLRQIQ